MKKVLLSSAVVLSAVAATSVVFASTLANSKDNPNNRFGSYYAQTYQGLGDKVVAPSKPTQVTPATPATPEKPATPKKPVAVVQVQQPKGDKKDGVLQEVSSPVAPKKPVAVTAKKDLPSEENVTGTTNSRYGSASQKEETAKDGQKYETFKAVETYGNTNYSYNGSYDDGKRLVTVDPNSRYGSASQEEKTATDGQQYETFKAVETFVSTNYSSVVNQ